MPSRWFHRPLRVEHISEFDHGRPSFFTDADRSAMHSGSDHEQKKSRATRIERLTSAPIRPQHREKQS